MEKLSKVRQSSGNITNGFTCECSKSIAFSLATLSTLPNPSRWECPTSVTITKSGEIVLASMLISPTWFIPASTTAYLSLSLFILRIVNGTPRWLFKFPSVHKVSSSPKIRAKVSLVDVFPQLPVTPTTDPSNV
ncbi:MAG: hypothetical protein VX969_09020, partial [Verrucomicrobiota bacterium]|nr:hypothetical protein [Verrucomicrobiota bacterium]